MTRKINKQIQRYTAAVRCAVLCLSIIAMPNVASAYHAVATGDDGPVNWNGFYLGVMGGYDWAGYASTATSFNFDGFADGLFLGLNVEEHGILYGLDVRLNWTALHETSGAITAALPWTSDVRMRFGTVYQETLIYGALGIAFANMTYDDGTIDSQNTHLGWTLGLGGEYMLGYGLFARADYSFTGYFNARYNSAQGSIDARPGDHQQLRVGLGIRF